MTKTAKLTSGDVRGFIKQTKASNGFLLHLLTSAEARDTVKGLLHVQPEAGNWCGYAYVPVGSPAERIVQAFEQHTDIPLELPFHAAMFYLSGYLMQQGVRIDFGGRLRTPELWTIVLAPSGCGKTFSAGIIAKASPVPAAFPDCASGAMFVQAMAEHEQKGETMLWQQDEIAQKLKQIECTGSCLADMKEYLLKAYDGSKVERTTKTGGSIVVQRPCLGILGLNTDEGFFKAISPESLVDGFAQRFGFVLAQRDPKRPMRDFPMYPEDILNQAARKAFDDLMAVSLCPVYRFGEAAQEAYCEVFRGLAGTSDIPESFFRRVMFRTVKYALLYHLLLGKITSEIDAEDVGWAARLCRQHLIDAKRMLAGSLSDINRMVEAAERLKARLASEGRRLTARDVVRGVHGIKTAAEARGLLALVEDTPMIAKAA